jgi:hypothetical protein
MTKVWGHSPQHGLGLHEYGIAVVYNGLHLYLVTLRYLSKNPIFGWSVHFTIDSKKNEVLKYLAKVDPVYLYKSRFINPIK